MSSGEPVVASVYLDTNVIFGIRSRDLGSEQAPVSQILRAHKQGVLSLVTSREASDEIKKGNDFEADEDIYSLLVDVPAVEGEELALPLVTNRGGSRLAGPVSVVTDADLAFLRATLPDATDANHVFQAITNRVDYFVTADRKTILRHAPTIEGRYGIRLRSSSALVAELGL